MRLTAAANKKPVNGSTTTIAIRQTSILSPTLVARGVGFGATIRAERRKEDADQGRKYAAAGADEITSQFKIAETAPITWITTHELRFIACEKRLDRELARHGKRLSLHLNQNIHTFPSSGAAGAFERKDMCQPVLLMKHLCSVPQWRWRN
jgi:hypothetical protein